MGNLKVGPIDARVRAVRPPLLVDAAEFHEVREFCGLKSDWGSFQSGGHGDGFGDGAYDVVRDFELVERVDVLGEGAVVERFQ